MGWVKNETMDDEVIFNELISTFKDKFAISRGVAKSCSSSVYEYLTDYIRDYYDVTLYQCDRVAKRVSNHLGIKHLYHHKP